MDQSLDSCTKEDWDQVMALMNSGKSAADVLSVEDMEQVQRLYSKLVMASSVGVSFESAVERRMLNLFSLGTGQLGKCLDGGDIGAVLGSLWTWSLKFQWLLRQSLIRVKAASEADCGEADLDRVGDGRGFLVTEDIVSAILQDSGTADLPLASYPRNVRGVPLQYVEAQFASAIAMAPTLPLLLLAVKFWLVLGARLGFGTNLKPVLEQFDVVIEASETTRQCYTQSILLECYQKVTSNHSRLQAAASKLVILVLEKRPIVLGTTMGDTMFCGRHAAYMCPVDGTFDDDWKGWNNGVQPGGRKEDLRPLILSRNSLPCVTNDDHKPDTAYVEDVMDVADQRTLGGVIAFEANSYQPM